MFKISHFITGERREKAKGFTMEFENGNTISVQFGRGNYCVNQNDSEGKHYSADAEIAIWNSENKWYDFGADTVRGWCTPDEVAKWIHFASTTKF